MNKIRKSKEVLIEEAIHRNKARIEKRKKLCLKDDCEIEDTQIHETSFKGTHPVGEDANKERRQEWLKDCCHPDPYARYYKFAIIAMSVYVGLHLIGAFINYLINY